VTGRKKIMIPADRGSHGSGVLNEEGKNTHHGCCDMERCAVCGEQFLLDVNHGGEIELLAELPKGAKLAED
jgi:hypothetical protein